jgi:glyoxylase-like metal-dependent hydrolase (beta-lactamase superfamily II)
VLPLVEQGRVTFFNRDAEGAIEQELDHNLLLVSLPGHCPGHTGLMIRSPSRNEALITGDAIHHPIQLARPDWYCAADIDPALSSQTRRGLIDKYADTALVLLSGHFAGATAGRIVSRAGAIRFDFID